MKYYSPSSQGFYTPEINTVMPDDVIEITDAYWESLLGKEIYFDGEKPVAKVYSEEELAEFDRQAQERKDRATSARSKLAALGLTEAEIDALLGL